MTVEGHIENGQIILDQKVALPDGVKVRVELLSASEPREKANSAAKTQYEHYKSIIGAIDDLPVDFALEHDHYIHGTPKK